MAVESPSPAQPAPTIRFVRHLARQPILSADENVFGYELLFRDGTLDYFGGVDFDVASRSVLDASLLIGLDVLCDGRRAFVNCTREILLQDYMSLLPADRAVLEIVPGIPADDDVAAACQRMRSAGYLIALDNFVPGDGRDKLAPLVDIIKVDVRRAPVEEIARQVKCYATKDCHMLAEKVETREQFLAARNCGFTYFQGYFFRKPERMKARDIPANHVNYLRLLQAVSRKEIDAQEIEDVFRAEPSLCYRLLRYLNSPVYGLATEIRSVRHALAMLGEREIRRWVRLAATLVAGQGKTSDLILSALVRARFCELLAPRVPHGDSDLFLVGLLSLMDAILEIPMGLVLEGIAVDSETKAVLLGKEGRLLPIFQLMQAQESGNWPQATALSLQLGLPESFVAESYWHAMEWARTMTNAG